MRGETLMKQRYAYKMVKGTQEIIILETHDGAKAYSNAKHADVRNLFMSGSNTSTEPPKMKSAIRAQYEEQGYIAMPL